MEYMLVQRVTITEVVNDMKGGLHLGNLTGLGIKQTYKFQSIILTFVWKD